MENTEVDLEALLSVPSVTGYDVSNDDEIVFASNTTGQFQLYLGKLARDGLEDCKQLTSDDESKVSPKFYPDSKKILYASDQQGDEKFNLYLLGLEKVERLTNARDFSIYPNASFSKDGKKIAFVSNQQRQFATYIIDLESRHSSRVSYHVFSDQFATISPNNSWIAYSSHVKAQESAIFVASLEDPSCRIARITEEGFQIDASAPTWSPDNKKIAFVSASKGMYDIGMWTFETDEIRWLTKSDREYYDPIFSNDGKKLAYTVNTGGDIKLVIHDLESDGQSAIEFRHGVIDSPKFSPDDKSIFFEFSGPRNPYDVWQYRFSDEKFVQITNSLPEEVAVSNFVEAEQIFYTNKKDGMRVPALIYMPNRSAANQTRKRVSKEMRGKNTREHLPAVIDIHGGPTAQPLNSWAPIVQALVAKGFAVIRPNYRGSSGYGKSFRESNRFLMGDMDLMDCVSGRDFLVERNIADPKRIAVSGGSFGGYLTMCCLAKEPEAWACGSALVPFLNWFTEIKNEREELRFWDLQNMGDPEKDTDRLRNASPIFCIDRIKAPVLLIAGANDPRCPMEEAQQAKDELEKLGRPVELKVYSDEGHGFRKTKNRVEVYKTIILFLERNTAKKSS
ncbi:MAG: S9 family peptidase [Thaumarchaeota archaeon]|nr:S9 family peptidase [Nitrososphaerota archaeon]